MSIQLIEVTDNLEFSYFFFDESISKMKLMFDRNSKWPIFIENVFDINSELIVRLDLLLDEAIFFKIFV